MSTGRREEVKEKVYELNDWAAVQKVYKEKKSKRETARVLGMSKNTVKKLLALDEPPVYQRAIYHSCIDPYKEQMGLICITSL